MARSTLSASLETVRRLAVTKQHLAGPLPKRVTPAAILSVVRDLAYVQWDPVSIVAPSHIISFWSRLGRFRLAELDRLLWNERKLFQHWIPFASIVLTEDYPLYHSLMKRYPDSLSNSWGVQREAAKRFLAKHAGLRKKVLQELSRGPRRLDQFEDHVRTRRADGEWTPASDVSHMLAELTLTGEVMVVGHQGNQNLWGLTGQFLPNWVERTDWSAAQADREAAQRAIRALGTADPREINHYFVRGWYHDLSGTLERLLKDSLIHRVEVAGLGPRDERYIHERDVPLLESLSSEEFEPRMSLLAPFDNLVCSQTRAKRLFGFDYVREQFLPAAKRKFGTYVLPILWGSRFIGRIDPSLDKETGQLRINSVHAEPHAPASAEVVRMIRQTIDQFAGFLGAAEVRFTSRVPEPWKPWLH